jgi:hypothetical protein
MSSLINADNGVVSGISGLKSTADNSGILELQTNGTTSLTINASQNVGIGTASPVGKLQVNGLTFLYNEGSATSRFLMRNTTTGASAGGFDVNQVGNDTTIFNSSNGYLSLGTNNTERARIDSSGRLLVGQTSSYDNATLCVTSPSQLYSLITDGGTTSNRSRGGFYHPSVNVLALNVDGASGVLAFTQNSTERVRIDSSGNFMVGATSSNFKLTISGGGDVAVLNASSSGQVLRMTQSSANPLIVRMVNNSSNFWDTQANTDNSISWDYNDSEKMRITSGGQVKIATGSGQTRSENGVATWYTSGFTNNNSAITFDIAVPNDDGFATGHHIEANHTHYTWSSYGAFLDIWVSTRGSGVIESYTNFNVSSGNGGSWSVSKPNNTTLRVTKSAGSYSGGGYYWIKVTTNTTI